MPNSSTPEDSTPVEASTIEFRSASPLEENPHTRDFLRESGYPPAPTPDRVEFRNAKNDPVASSAPPPMSVHAAIAAVMGELPNIGKDDRSPEGFNFRGIEAMTRHVQPLLAKHGLVIVPAARVTQVVASPAMKEGWQDVYVEVTWTIVGPDGSQLTARTNGIGRDRVDRGASKAQTQAYKYLLLHLLCIADGKDDTDAQTYEADRTEMEDPAVPGLRSSLEGAIAKLSDDEKAELKAWFAANGLPAVRRMNAAQCDAVLDHLMGAPASEPAEPT